MFGREWSYPLGGCLMNDGSYMMIPSKYISLTRISCETNKYVCFKRKEESGMDNFLGIGLGNYVFLEDIVNKRPVNPISDGLWKFYFDGAFSRHGSEIRVIIESPYSKMKPHAYKLEFECTNIEAEYEALIQVWELVKEMNIKSLSIFGDLELVVNQVKNIYGIRNVDSRRCQKNLWFD